MRNWIAIAVAGMALAGCSGSERTYTHTDAEEKAMQEVKNLTPEQQIERAMNSPLPQETKDSLIKSIKEKNGLK